MHIKVLVNSEKNYLVKPTFHPMLSKNVRSRACPVVLPPHGPEKPPTCWCTYVYKSTDFTQTTSVIICPIAIAMAQW